MDAATPWRLMGQALLDFQSDESRAGPLVAHCHDGEAVQMPAGVFFRTRAEFSEIERLALSLCAGRVLDAGAGAGCHSLVLQEFGMEVVAIDILPEAVAVMRARGVNAAFCADIFQFEAEPFDTILMMMNGIGVVEDLAGLHRFFRRAQRLVAPHGQILLDSMDLGRSRELYDPAQPEQYTGIVTYEWEYRGERGPAFRWLYIDSVTLAECAARTGWRCEIRVKIGNGDYLARLQRQEDY